MDKIQKITACAFIYNYGKVLVAQRALTKKFMPGIFELPGGHIEFGESVEDGLKREIMEELGIDIIIKTPYLIFDYVSQDGTKQTFEIMYLCTMESPDQKIITRPEELAGFKWIGKEELKKYLKENPEELRAAEKGFQLIAK